MPLPATKAVLVKARASAKASSLVSDIESDFIKEARDSVVAAIDDGLSFAAWEDSFTAIADRYGMGTDSTYTEMVFRTVGQSAYNGGKVSEMFGPEGQDRAGYWMFNAIMDDRTTDECAQLDGQIFAKTDSDAMAFIPPLDFNCRSTIIELDASEVDGQKVSYANTTDVGPIEFDNDLLVV